MPNVNIFNEEIGLLKRGAILSYNAVEHTIKVRLNINLSKSNQPVEMPAPNGYFSNNGLFIGSRPIQGTPVVVSIGSGGQYYFVSFLIENTPLVPFLKKDELILSANENTSIKIDLSSNISLGSNNNKVHYSTSRNYASSNFHNQYDFTQASRKVDGHIKRDLKPNVNFDTETRLEDDSYDSKYYIIPLDPTVTYDASISGTGKNPARVEQREIVYDLGYESDVEDDLTESFIYTEANEDDKEYLFPNRRKSRADVFSLSLVSPNYLMETIKGTGVDIFGNILDINRKAIPIGKDDATLQGDRNLDKAKAFLSIKDLDRKSLAFHFELNARKDLFQNGQIELPDITSNEDYARSRSRFFVDIDKEGQLKLNIPASSETGNVPLLTRYENYSTYGEEDNGNPNKLFFREDGLDIFHDSFAAPRATPNDDGFSFSNERGSIQIKDGDLNGAPIDRITEQHIKHGTAFHDILNTCFVHQNNTFLNYQNGSISPLTVELENIPELTNVVVDEILVSGENANAGGRSAAITLDGSLELNLGANTSDRLSLVADFAGGVVANIGRDLNNRSAQVTMNGDFYLQVGGYGVVGDSRFVKQFNGNYGAVLDLRVMTSGGYTHMVRIDDKGITVMTPGSLKIHSKGDMNVSTDANMHLNAENMYLQKRLVNKQFGGSI